MRQRLDSHKTSSIQPANKSKLAHILPSSGQASNPQLFGQTSNQETAIQSSITRKRKRQTRNTGDDVVLPKELDFFGDGSHHNAHLTENCDVNTMDKKVGPTSKETGESDNTMGEHKQATDEFGSILSQEECKRVLRSHKVKVTLLEDYGNPKPGNGNDNPKKRQKVRETQQNLVSKNAKILLYPQPLTSFAQLRSRYKLSKRLTENIAAEGYTIPTEVQLGSLPLLLNVEGIANGNTVASQREVDYDKCERKSHDIDLLTVAPTGSGKTIAFLIPVISAILQHKVSINVSLENSNLDGLEGPKAIIIAPTKELAGQIVNEARKLSQRTQVRVSLMRKGMEVVPRTRSDNEDGTSSESEGETAQESQSKAKGPLVKSDILVSTPLILLNALESSEGRCTLSTVRYLVLDEADVLLDSLFRQQTLDIWNCCSNPMLRVSLWSATMGSSIEELARTTIDKRWNSISDKATGTYLRPKLVRLIVGLKDTAVPNISHKLTYAATEQGKLLAVRQLLHPTTATSGTSLRPPFLIFTQTIPRAIALHSELLYDIPPEAGGSSRIAVLHADLSDSARDSVMARFRNGEVWILITTDLLARGVDFRGLNGVVNYDVPNSAAAYVHRVGRTGRAGREGGMAVTLYTKEDIPYIKNIANVIAASEKLRGVPEGEGDVKQWLLDMLPTPTKREKQRLKKRGVEARRPGKETSKARISTKSGFERRIENNRRGAMAGNKSRKEYGAPESSTANEFEGFED